MFPSQDDCVIDLTCSSRSLIIGLDINSRSTGYCILDKDDSGKLLQFGVIETTPGLKATDYCLIARDVVRVLSTLLQCKYDLAITNLTFAVEAPKKMFVKGHFNQKHLVSLAMLNASVCSMILISYSSNPLIFNESTCRSRLKIKNKMDAVDWARLRMTETQLCAFNGMKSTARGDVADSIVIARYCYIILISDMKYDRS